MTDHTPAAAPAADRAAPADWIDGHPQLEAIAAAVWEKCGRSDSGLCIEDDPRNIAVAALAAVLAVLPDVAEEQRLALSEALGLGTGAPWDAIRDRAAELRRLAGEERPETEAHPAEHTWSAELYDPLADQWAPGTRYPVRDRAVAALEHGRRVGATWKDGTPTERRLVRTTTTYTVEPDPVAPTTADEAQP